MRVTICIQYPPNIKLLKRIRSLSILKSIIKRGTISGKSKSYEIKICKIPAITSNFIERICANANSKYKYDFRGRNHANLLNVKQKTKDASPAENKEFVPGLILSNIMSLVREMDERKAFISTAETTTDIICITQTWLNEHIPDNMLTLRVIP